MRSSHAVLSFTDRRRQNDTSTTTTKKSKPKQANRVTWAPNFPSNAKWTSSASHRPPVEWHCTGSEFASTQKHQVHARIFKWIYVRNKQTPTKPRLEQHVLVSHTWFFFSFKLLHRGNDAVRCSSVSCVLVLHVTVTASMLHFKSKIYYHSSTESMHYTLQTGKCTQW